MRVTRNSDSSASSISLSSSSRAADAREEEDKEVDGSDRTLKTIVAWLCSGPACEADAVLERVAGAGVGPEEPSRAATPAEVAGLGLMPG